jgi:type II secretory pathway pseudopilin PulG
MTRNPKLLIAVVAVLAALAAYWMLLLSPQREKAAKLQTDIEAAQVQLQQAEATLTTYRAARKTYRTNYSTLVRLGKAVPANDDVRSLMVQLDSAAGSSGVDFRTIQVGGGSGGAAATTSSSEGAAPPPGAVSIGTAGFSAMPFTLTFRGSFFNMSSFFTRLERFVRLRNEQLEVTGRLMRVESFTLAPDEQGFPNIKAEIGASSYLVPATEGVTGGATPAGPAATTTTGVKPAGTPATPPTTATANAGATE